jgi:S-adenosylmethionine:tRNA ribosyltransferase-isomerase
VKKNDFYYDLPKHLIAQQPIEKRDGSRLMVLNRKTGDIEHRMFTDILSILKPGDCIVINDSKVIPARLLGYVSVSGSRKKDNAAFPRVEKDNNVSPTVEFLLHERLEGNRWTVLAKPGKKARPGDVISFGEGRLLAKIIKITEGGLRVAELIHEGELEPLLEEIGEMPLPHYIEEKQTDTTRYQTVYAKADDAGASVAAPTAGLHFTQELLDDLQKKGVKIARVTLHVGIGTFRPVKEEDITRHPMHSEYCRISPQAAEMINETKRNGGRVIAIGTTSCRTLESRAVGAVSAAGATDVVGAVGAIGVADTTSVADVASVAGSTSAADTAGAIGKNMVKNTFDENGKGDSDLSQCGSDSFSCGSGLSPYAFDLSPNGCTSRVLPGAGKTDIFIYPGYDFQIIDGLLTNFHLPESTLIMLVSALAGHKQTMAAYREAVAGEYRFFSYGDAMLVI